MPENNHAGPGGFGFDARVAHPARVYDYWLGGKDNFAADRIAGEETIAAYPAIRASARANRAFLARSVRYLAAEAGIRQFLDIGTGLPTASNTHEVAQSVAPDSRIVYVDSDPLVLAHARALLTSSPEGATAYLDADLRDIDEILEQAAGTLDLTQPVGVMLLAILHYIPDLDQARRIMARLVGALPSGSFVTISHAASDISPEAMAEMIKRMNQHLAEANHVGRTRDVVAGLFDGLDLLEPGVVKVTQWRPSSDVEAGGPTSLWGGVGRKPLPVKPRAARLDAGLAGFAVSEVRGGTRPRPGPPRRGRTRTPPRRRCAWSARPCRRTRPGRPDGRWRRSNGRRATPR
jgi:trans-aconitate methyltransferase